MGSTRAVKISKGTCHKIKIRKGKGHREEFSKSVHLTSVVLAPQISGKDHMRRPGNKKDAPAKRRGFGENIYQLKISDKTTFCTPIEVKAMRAPSSTRPEEREFVVDSGASMHTMSKKS